MKIRTRFISGIGTPLSRGCVAATPTNRSYQGFLKHWLLLIGLLASLTIPNQVEAKGGIYIEMRLLGPVHPATNGVPYEGTLEWFVPRTTTITGVSLHGTGWNVEHTSAPESVAAAPKGFDPAAFDRVDVFHVRFRATPQDASLPLKVEVASPNLVVPQWTLDLSPQQFEPGTTEAFIPGPALLELLASRARDEASGGKAPSPAVEGEFALSGGGNRRIRVSGFIYYPRPDGSEMPADGCTVEVFDSNFGVIPDNELDTTRADEDGYYSASFDWPPFFGGGLLDPDPDIYIRVVARNGVATVENPISANDYKWESPMRSNYSGDDLQMSVTLASEPGAMNILSTATKAWRYLEEKWRYDTPSVEFKWPGPLNASYFSWPLNNIRLKEGDQWKEGAIVHEYGHHWMHKIGLYERDLGLAGTHASYCNDVCDGADYPWPDGCGHCAWCRENETVAFQEGVAHFLAHIVVRDWTRRYGTRPIDWGPNASHDFNYLGDDGCGTAEPAPRTEGYLAALLVDIEDSPDDDPPEPDKHAFTGAQDGVAGQDALALGLAPILSVLEYDLVEYERAVSAHDFINEFLDRYPEYHHQLFLTAANNRFSIQRPPEPAKSTEFSDDFSRPDGLPGSQWDRFDVGWFLRGGELRIDTGSGAAYQIYGRPSLVNRLEETLDVVGQNVTNELIHFQGGYTKGWLLKNVTRDVTQDPAEREKILIRTPPQLISRGPDSLDAFGVRSTTAGKELVHYAWTEVGGWRAENVTLRPEIGTLNALGRTFDFAPIVTLFGQEIRIYGENRRYRWSPTVGWTVDQLPRTLYPGAAVVELADGSSHVFTAGASGSCLGCQGRSNIFHLSWRPSSTWKTQDLTQHLGGNQDIQLDPTFGGYYSEGKIQALSTDGVSLTVAFSSPRRIVEIPGPFPVFSNIPPRLVVYQWNAAAGWSGTNVTALLGGVGFEDPWVTSRAPGMLDVLGTRTKAIVDGVIDSNPSLVGLHYKFGNGGWSVAEMPFVTASGPARHMVSLLPTGSNRLDVIVRGLDRNTHDDPRYFSWEAEDGWVGHGRLLDLSAQVVSYPVTLSTALARVDGGLDAFGYITAQIGGLVHLGTVRGLGWIGENLNGLSRRDDPWIFAGDPALWFEGATSIKFRLRFGSQPAGPGRRGGAFVFGQAGTPAATGNCGYLVYFSDEAPGSGYRIERYDFGQQVGPTRRASAANPGENWHVIAQANRLFLFVDGRQVLDFSDTDPLRAGTLAFWADAVGQDVRIDNVRIGPLTVQLEARLTNSRQIELTIRGGDTGADYFVESSSDTHRWDFMTRVTKTSADPVLLQSFSGPQRFYRVRVTQ